MKKIVSILLVLAMIAAFTVPVFAANVGYSFNLTNEEGRDFTVYKDASNTKLYVSQPGSIRCTTNAMGLGYRMHLVAKNWFGLSWPQATVSNWFSGTNVVRHPEFLENMAKENKDYYIAGRIDDDYSGPYYANGVFNSDNTSV